MFSNLHRTYSGNIEGVDCLFPSFRGIIDQYRSFLIEKGDSIPPGSFLAVHDKCYDRMIQDVSDLMRKTHSVVMIGCEHLQSYEQELEQLINEVVCFIDKYYDR